MVVLLTKTEKEKEKTQNTGEAALKRKGKIQLGHVPNLQIHIF